MIVGMLMNWSGTPSNIPAGWRECDGSEVDTNTFADLYNVIGTSYGANPPSGHFYLPDLRGRFVRGFDGDAGHDPDKSSRTDMRNPAISTSEVGSLQMDAFQTHTHISSHCVAASTQSSDGTIDDGHGYHNNAGGAPNSGKVSASETRPVNAYLCYIIYTGVA